MYIKIGHKKIPVNKDILGYSPVLRRIPGGKRSIISINGYSDHVLEQYVHFLKGERFTMDLEVFKAIEDLGHTRPSWIPDPNDTLSMDERDMILEYWKAYIQDQRSYYHGRVCGMFLHDQFYGLEHIKCAAIGFQKGSFIAGIDVHMAQHEINKDSKIYVTPSGMRSGDTRMHIPGIVAYEKRSDWAGIVYVSGYTYYARTRKARYANTYKINWVCPDHLSHPGYIRELCSAHLHGILIRLPSGLIIPKEVDDLDLLYGILGVRSIMYPLPPSDTDSGSPRTPNTSSA